ncbi:ADP-ribosylglycohydrolase [Oceaniferula spumae]|uniref:ADP-ribosylglycohydrolase n=1 Tax=Oceaniferula spumae TaxID=2979115 RepID=A0AAT9FLD6_9BACT
MIEKQTRYQGALLGLACGDALGTTVEFQPRGSFKPLTDIVGGGPFSLKAGEWTDDTSMALSLAESLLTHREMQLADQLNRYTFWWRHGENSVTGECFDIGNTVRSALENYARTDDPHSGATDPMSAGNGSIMRLAPVPLFYANATTEDLLNMCRLSSVTTHGAAECLGACQLLGYLIRRALTADDKDEALSVGSDFMEHATSCPASITAIANQDYRDKDALDIRGTGYVVKSLEAALWAFLHTESFEEGALKAVNLGDDADTTGAVYGQIAGAFYGKKGIPKHWLKKLAWRKKITRLADRLYLAAEESISS